MISPLQTWQHRDPKGLWPALGGLAFLAHVGAIGMSVPYLLSWQASGKQSSVAAIPIELVAIAPADSASGTQQGEPEPLENSRAASQDSQLPDALASTSESSSNSGSASQRFDETAIAQDNVPVSAPSDLSTSRELANSSVEQSDPEPPVAKRPGSSEQTSPKKSQDSNELEDISSQEDLSDEEVSPQEDLSDKEGTDESLTDSQTSVPSDESANGLQDDEPPTIESNESLPPPSTGSESSQSLQLRITGDPQHDPRADFESIPPKLVGTGYVEVVPSDRGCRTVGAQAIGVPLTYRIGVNEDGTIYDANIQNDRSAAISNEDDEAVTCLIVKSGIVFSRAGNSAARIDDSLLITFELNKP